MRIRHLTLILALLYFAAPLHAADDPKPAKMNVIFIVVDDLCCKLGCYGVNEVRSPNIDRLAAKGVRFDRAYCQFPLCNPSRASFLTGLRVDTTGITDNAVPLRRKLPNAVILPQLFRENGYATAGLGKVLHVGVDKAGNPVKGEDAKSWDKYEDFETPANRKGEGRNLTGGAIKAINWLSVDGPDEDEPDAKLALSAVKFLEENKKKPFFLAVGFHRPHDPFHAPKKYFDMYPLDKITLHVPPKDRSPEVPGALPTKHALYKMGDKEGRELKRAYYACTTFLDAQVGRLLEALDRLQLWDNTIVVLIGDHGYQLGEHDWWNKSMLFEPITRPPLLVWAPGHKGMGKSAAGIVEFIDIYPSLAELCKLTPPSNLAGASFRPILDDPSRPGKTAAYTQSTRGGGGRTVRTDRWRYTEWAGGKNGVELYDQSADPLDYHNLAGQPALAETERTLKKLLADGRR